jgi:hypothetical protein
MYAHRAYALKASDASVSSDSSQDMGLCDLYLVLGSDPVWSTRGSEATCYLLGEVRINRSSRRSVYVDQR